MLACLAGRLGRENKSEIGSREAVTGAFASVGILIAIRKGVPLVLAVVRFDDWPISFVSFAFLEVAI